MADYREFQKKVQRRRLKKRAAAVVAVLAAMLAIGGSVWLVADGMLPFGGMEKSTAVDSAVSSAAASAGSSAAVSAVSVSSTVPEEQPASAMQADSAASAGLPVEAGPAAFALMPNADAEWNNSGYGVHVLNDTRLTKDDGSTVMDFRLMAQPGGSGVADMSYFDHVTFVGDSITQGLEIYEQGVPNAHYCAYKGIGPNAIVNGATVKRVDGGQEIAMDALIASNPDVVYILLGTNVLTSNGSYASFLAYYNQMIDMIQQALPNATIYIQSITPVRPGVKDTPRTAGLNTERLRAINNDVAAMAQDQGCYFIDLWEALADDEGNLNTAYAQPDGIHLKPEGYQAWVYYLRTHTKYSPSVPYEPGTSYTIES